MKKYHKVLKEDYIKWHSGAEEYKKQVDADPNRLTYHLMPETGWLNDPNGLCQIGGEYHIYYQYTPFEPTGEIKLWGHYTTRDFISYKSWEPALYPDQDFDAHGVYSGSAFPENGIIYYFYTGNVKYFDRDDYDYINSGRGSNTICFTSRDGFHFSEKKLMMSNEDYPQDVSCHVRDPKIYKRDGVYYMVLGARDRESRGMVLVYRSEDLEHWNYFNRISTEEVFGYMWECPDLFELDGQLCLISCPQGVAPSGVDYQNVHQCTIMKLDYDFEKNVCQVRDDIAMVDRGFDFYAPQTFSDDKGRRILIGWMGIPDADYTNPTTEDGWQHALTLPRELSMKEGKLFQRPVEEILKLRRGKRSYNLENGRADGLQQENRVVYEADVAFEVCEDVRLSLRKGVTLSFDKGILTLDLGNCGSGRTFRQAELKELKSLQIFSDTSSLEIFVNEGQQVFTTRVYGLEGGLAAEGSCRGMIDVYDMGKFQIETQPDSSL